MKFKNKLTQEIVEANGYAQEFAYTHNSKWEKVEKEKNGDYTIAEIKEKLNELEIEYDSNAKKAELLALLPKE